MLRIHPTADVASSAQLGEGTVIWDHAKFCEDCIIGGNVIISLGVYVGNAVSIGANSKIQNYALVYEPALLEKGVFVGPGVIRTNNEYPRSVNPDGSQKSGSDWDPVGVVKHQS